MDYPSQVEIRLYCENGQSNKCKQHQESVFNYWKVLLKSFSASTASFLDSIQTKGKLRALIQYVP